MAAPVSLEDIVETFELQSDEYLSFMDRESGEVHTVERYLLRQAEEAAGEDEELDLPAWQVPEWALAKRFVCHPESFERLPTQYDVHEWEILKNFADSVENPRIARELRDAIHGAGAFRMFKSVVRRHHIDRNWDDFRQKALEQIARDWCEEHHIPWK